MTPRCREAGRLRFCVLGQDRVGGEESAPLAGVEGAVNPALGPVNPGSAGSRAGPVWQSSVLTMGSPLARVQLGFLCSGCKFCQLKGENKDFKALQF